MMWSSLFTVIFLTLCLLINRANAQGSTTSDIRLPTNLKPLNYDVALQPNIYGKNPAEFNISGQVKIKFKCEKKTNVITLHAAKLEIESIEVKGKNSAIEAKNWTIDTDRDFLVIQLSGTLRASRSYVAKIRYTAKFHEDLMGAYLNTYKNDKNETAYLVATQMQPTSARKVIPCFDEPALKATFSVTIRRKAHLKALANAKLERSSAPSKDGWIDDKFAKSPKMSTYLLAFFVSDFAVLSKKTKKGVEVRIWAKKEVITQGEFASSIATKLIEYFEAYYGIPYPLTKLDMVGIPLFSAGAMENWGLIIYRDLALLYQEGVTTLNFKLIIAKIIAHEIAHQWFGNLVTPSWWDDLWLNEGFATYMSYLAVHDVQPVLYQEWRQFLLMDTEFTLVKDSMVNSHPIYATVNQPTEIGSIFDFISYDKSKHILYMMNFFLGNQNFKSGITKYLKDHQYSTATHVQLFDVLSEVSGMNVSEKVLPWVRQMGYPVVTIRRNAASPNQAAVTQEHFLLDPNSTAEPSEYNYKWHIPLTFSSKESTPNWNPSENDVTWMNLNDISLDKLPKSKYDWIVANINYYAFIRVNYDANNWNLLRGQLLKDHQEISVFSRAQLLNDAFNLVIAERLDIEIAMGMTEYMAKEEDYLVWFFNVENLRYIEDMLKGSDTYDNFSAYMRSLVSRLYSKLGWEPKANESVLIKPMILELSCRHNKTKCVGGATKRFRKWMASPDTVNIDPDIRFPIACTVLRNNVDNAWEQVFQLYNATKQFDSLVALSCTNDQEILKRMLEMSIAKDGPFPSTDTPFIVDNVARNAAGRQLAWDFVVNNWDALYERFKLFPVDFIGSASQHFNTDGELKQLESFVNSHSNLTVLQGKFQNAVERVKNNIRWSSNNKIKISNFLKNRA